MDLAGSGSLGETASGGNWLQETQPTKLYPQRPEAHHCRPLQKNPSTFCTGTANWWNWWGPLHYTLWLRLQYGCGDPREWKKNRERERDRRTEGQIQSLSCPKHWG